MGLKGSRGVQDRRAIARRVADLEARRRVLIPRSLSLGSPWMAARAWAAAREFDEGRPGPAGGRGLVEAVFGPEPPVDVVDCHCPGCPTKVPATWEIGLCGPCLNADCTHPIPADEA